MFWFFNRKKEAEDIKKDVKSGFESVKKDITSISGWINYLDSEKNITKKDILDMKEDLSSIKKEIEGLKNVVSFMGQTQTNRVFKTPARVFDKQTVVLPVQTAVQTAVQTPNLDRFSTTERAILWVLLNSELKLSYDDLSAVLGKERSTIRGQINSIKQKGEIIQEVVEENGKKRVFIPEEIKEKLLKKAKVRVSGTKKAKKNEKS
ncbi:MAG TPA: hypothetical protein PLK34_02620 [Candidatus Pacearchaeota archaeon]|nr:hypothetical protein [Candidatus Pacearchaeota archaeon]